MEASEIRDQYHRLLEGVSPNAAIAALDNYENVRREKERLRQENEVLDRRYGAAQDELIHYREQTILLQRQLDQELQEKKKVIYQERENQRENMMAAYAQLHKLARDKDVESARVEHLQQQLQETNAEINRLLSLQVQTDEDVKRLRAERNSAKQEYSRVMSERDSILKENEHLTEERTSLCSRLKISEANEKVAQQQLTVLRSELEKGKQERDEFKNSRIGSGSSSTQLCSTCGAGLTHSANLSHVSVGDISGSIGSSGDMAIDINMEELRGQLEALKGDSEKLRQDRDWAMSERERIVAERDSLRLMTDQLRKERDDANTRLGRAIKDADDLKRQREKVELEMREIKDKMESELQALSERSNCDDSNSPSHSRDSAIDADMAEWEIETLVENMSGCSKAEDLGIELGGGRDDPVMGCFYPIYVKNISMGSKFDGVLRVYDCLLQVNNIDVTSMERKSVIDILKNSTQCKMMIKRRRLVGMKLLSVPLDYVDGKGNI